MVLPYEVVTSGRGDVERARVVDYGQRRPAGPEPSSPAGVTLTSRPRMARHRWGGWVGRCRGGATYLRAECHPDLRRVEKRGLPTGSAEPVEVEADRERLACGEHPGRGAVAEVAELPGPVAGDQRDRVVDVHDPVPLDPSVGVLATLDHVVGAAGARRDDLHDQQRLRRAQQPASARTRCTAARSTTTKSGRRENPGSSGGTSSR